MDKLKEFRSLIDGIDNQILDLLNQRAKIALEIGHFKKANKQELYVPSREQAIFDRLRSMNQGPFPTEAITKVYREIISASLSLEFPLKVVYLGPQATFTHIAALQKFGQSAQLVSAKTVDTVFDEVERGRAQHGVVPIENSNEGAVTHTLDRFMHSNLCIIAEHYLEISHDLLASTGNPDKITRIYSHPQAIEQCRTWLEEHFSGIPWVEVSSTARAAQIVAGEENTAAIANRYAASLYGLNVVASALETNPHNFTRFLVIGDSMVSSTGNDKTSLMFTFRDTPGILARMLEPFRKRGINLMKIESRPVKKKAWEYVFFLDIEGHLETGEIKDAVEELRGLCNMLKVLGSYPRSR